MRTMLLLSAWAAFVIMPVSERVTVVNVGVEDMNGQPVEHLTAKDFSLEVDGRAVPVTKVTHDSTNLSAALVLDLTASGFWPGVRGSVQETVRDHVLRMLRDDTAVLIGSFGRSVQWFGEFSTDRADQIRQLRSAASLPEAERTGPSPVWDAVSDGLSALEPRPGRKVVLLITDGQATGNRLGLAEVADRAIGAGVSVNIVFTGASGLVRQTRETAVSVRPERPLMQLASATGGYYAATPPQRLENAPVDALRRTATAMQSVYRLEFSGPVKSGFQRLVVTVQNPDHRVRAPLGFKHMPVPRAIIPFPRPVATPPRSAWPSPRSGTGASDAPQGRRLFRSRDP